MKKFFFLLLAIALGLALAVYRIADVDSSKAFFHNGSWIGSNSLPLGKNNLLTAQVTLFGLFALPSDEAIYLFSRKDDHAELLNGIHDYVLTGNFTQIKAKYWSITAYGKDLFLIPNEVNRYSFNNSNLQTDSLGNFSIIISEAKQSGNWLPIEKDKRFNLVLRIYKGDEAFVSHLGIVALPIIKRVAI
jgi:hypothetical protein